MVRLGGNDNVIKPELDPQGSFECTPQRDNVMRDTLEALADGFDELTVKGKKTAYLAMNGNMFAFVDDEGGLCLRFSEADKAAYNAENGTGDVIQCNAVMRGYVRVTDEILADWDRLEALFSDCVEFARTLKPKPTKKPSK